MVNYSLIAKKAWATRRSGKLHSRKSAARRAHGTMKKGRRINIHSASVKRNGHTKTTYAPPKAWWDHMTKDSHGSAGKPLSAPAAGHLWFKVYDDRRRLEALKQYG